MLDLALFLRGWLDANERFTRSLRELAAWRRCQRELRAQVQRH